MAGSRSGGTSSDRSKRCGWRVTGSRSRQRGLRPRSCFAGGTTSGGCRFRRPRIRCSVGTTGDRGDFGLQQNQQGKASASRGRPYHRWDVRIGDWPDASDQGSRRKTRFALGMCRSPCRWASPEPRAPSPLRHRPNKLWPRAQLLQRFIAGLADYAKPRSDRSAALPCRCHVGTHGGTGAARQGGQR